MPCACGSPGTQKEKKRKRERKKEYKKKKEKREKMKKRKEKNPLSKFHITNFFFFKTHSVSRYRTDSRASCIKG